MINTTFLTDINKVLDDLAPTYRSKFISTPIFLAHHAVATLAYFPFLRSLLFLSPLPWMLFLLLSPTGSFTSSWSQPKYLSLKGTSPKHYGSWLPTGCFISFTACVTINYYLVYLYIYYLSYQPEHKQEEEFGRLFHVFSWGFTGESAALGIATNTRKYSRFKKKSEYTNQML